MDLHQKLPAASPASTHCSELEYLIELQSEEISGSQPRRSQRLREKEQAILEARKEVSENRKNYAINNDGAGSPQLFVETDEEFSQLGQLPPKQAAITDLALTQVPQNVASKHSNNETPMDEDTKQKRHRRSLSKDKSRSRPRKRPESIKKPATLSSKLKLKTNPIQSQLGALVSYSKVDNADWHQFYNSQAIVIPSDSNSAPLEIKTSPVKQLESKQNPPIDQITKPYQICYQSKLKSRNGIGCVSGTKRGRPKKQPEAVSISAQGRVDNPRARGMSWQQSYQQPNVNPPNPTKPHPTVTAYPPELKPSALIANTTTTYAYQRINLTQTLLPERYPDHFIHQLPPESSTTNGVILSSELQRIGSGSAVRDSTRAPPATELRQMCPTPDTTPTVAHESFSPSPPIAESMNSTTPSLSDSLAEVFGTRKIRNILNIEPPRKYLVLEVHLPAIAFMLNVELGRLRAVLGMTQRLTLDQVQEMTQESREVISIHSSSEAEDNEEMQ